MWVVVFIRIINFLIDTIIFIGVFVVLFILLRFFFAQFNVLSGTMNVIQILSLGGIIIASFVLTAFISEYRSK
ncbi:hypothetical protein CGZ75_08330 [Paenibacillus herberti]|uniref:Uncharacterized protein n=1 Tax=Paenibacillus herberti TaxID=1619309 RepID=A0A229P335_9BACL|nr:hypothetical protein CGZ75_08330 [Paenibacillus herberti]